MGLENIDSWETPESVRRDAKVATMDYMFGSTISARNALSTKATGDEFKESFGSFSKSINSIGDVIQFIMGSLQTEGTGHDINTISDGMKQVSWDQWKGDEDKLRNLGVYDNEDLERLQDITGSAYIDASGGRGSGDYLRTAAEAAKALQRVAPQDFDATVTISTTGTPGGAAPVIVNNVSNNSSGGSTSAPTNNYLNITANATDPYTSKQPNLAYKRY
jgi:hypothetical protein